MTRVARDLVVIPRPSARTRTSVLSSTIALRSSVSIMHTTSPYLKRLGTGEKGSMYTPVMHRLTGQFHECSNSVHTDSQAEMRLAAHLGTRCLEVYEACEEGERDAQEDGEEG